VIRPDSQGMKTEKRAEKSKEKGALLEVRRSKHGVFGAGTIELRRGRITKVPT